MPDIHPAMATILEQAAALALPSRRLLTVDEARAQSREGNRRWNQRPVAMAEVREIAVPGPAGPVTVRLYYPPGLSRPAPTLLFIHGGGWVICDLDTHDAVCRRLAAAGGVLVASIDYRLAPEHPFPAGLEDCLAVTRWFAGHGAEVGADPTRLVIGGDSAGGNLALAALLSFKEAGERPCRGGLLVYGAFSDNHDTPSHHAFGGGEYLLSTDDMNWFWDHYLADKSARANPLASPLLGDLRGLPPLYVSAATLDPLLDDSVALSRRLTELAQPHLFDLWAGVCHASLNMADELPTIAAADRVMGAWLSATLRS